LTLSRLGRRQSEALIRDIVGATKLPAEVVHQILAKTDGVPLFVEELTKRLSEKVRQPSVV
jgi:predicted ATPase